MTLMETFHLRWIFCRWSTWCCQSRCLSLFGQHLSVMQHGKYSKDFNSHWLTIKSEECLYYLWYLFLSCFWFLINYSDAQLSKINNFTNQIYFGLELNCLFVLEWVCPLNVTLSNLNFIFLLMMKNYGINFPKDPIYR